MSDFAFQIVGDASKADRAINEVLSQLDRIDAEARAAGGSLTSSFAAAGSAISKASADARQSADAQRTLAQRMRGMSDELANQERMYQRIHGPAQRYMADLKALDSLLAQNEITVAQYTEQLTKMNRAIDGAPKTAPRAPTAGGGSSPVSGLLGGVRSGAAALGIGVGVGIAAQQIGGLANEFQNLQNRLRYLAGGDMQQVNSMVADLQGVATRTRGDLGATTEAFVRISLATKQMGLSGSETMKLTERLNKAIALSGASGAEAAAGMIQLSQGLASGALRGDELRSVMEQLPGVADVIAQGMGVTRGQLRQLGADGKITAEVIVEAFRKAGDTLDRDFGNTVPTISQSWTVFKNQMMVTAGELDQSLGITSALGSAMSALGAAVQLVVAPLRLVGMAIDALNDVATNGATALAAMAGGAMLLGGPAGALVGLGLVVADVAGVFDGDLGDAYIRAAKLQEEFNKAQTKVFYSMFQGAEATRQAYKEMTELSVRTMIGVEAAEAFARAWQFAAEAQQKMFTGSYAATRLDTVESVSKRFISERIDAVNKAKLELAGLTKAYTDGWIPVDLYRQKKEQLLAVINGTVAAYRREKKVHLDILADIRERIAAEESLARMKQDAQGFRRGEFERQFNTGDAEFKESQERDKELLEAAKEREKREQERIAALTKSWHERLKVIEQANQQFASSFAPIGDAIRDAFMQGELAADSLDQTLRQVSFNLFRFMALQAAASLGGSDAGFAGAILGGVFGNAPGMAHGGVIYEGNGGTDSQLVAIRKSPNERVTVETPSQYLGHLAGPGGGGGAAAGVTLLVMPRNDEREIVSGLSGAAGKTVVADIKRTFRERNA
jgi:tape measure domain-containing protein